jgi:hypothetical protein
MMLKTRRKIPSLARAAVRDQSIVFADTYRNDLLLTRVYPTHRTHNYKESGEDSRCVGIEGLVNQCTIGVGTLPTNQPPSL